MAEPTLTFTGLDKHATYTLLREQFFRVMDGLDDPIAAMATWACLTYQAFGQALGPSPQQDARSWIWSGFYRVAPVGGRLVVGPYQGTLGCTEIAFGRGVCGRAAETQTTIVVPDVHAFPDHIACDARSRSEIVVPVFDARGELIAVFDADAGETSVFDDVDAVALESAISWFKKSPAP